MGENIKLKRSLSQLSGGNPQESELQLGKHSHLQTIDITPRKRGVKKLVVFGSGGAQQTDFEIKEVEKSVKSGKVSPFDEEEDEKTILKPRNFPVFERKNKFGIEGGISYFNKEEKEKAIAISFRSFKFKEKSHQELEAAKKKIFRIEDGEAIPISVPEKKKLNFSKKGSVLGTPLRKRQNSGGNFNKDVLRKDKEDLKDIFTTQMVPNNNFENMLNLTSEVIFILILGGA